VAPDFFIRTSDEGHKQFVQEFLTRIKENGREDIYQGVYAGLYCVGCEAFKTEDELVDGKCPEHDIEPEWIEERNWFFRLSAYQEQLLSPADVVERVRSVSHVAVLPPDQREAVLDEVRTQLAAGPERRFKLAANLPYNIATPILSNLLASRPAPTSPRRTARRRPTC